MHDTPERDAPRPTTAQRREKAENPWLSLGINIVIPALILMKLSGEDRLGPVRWVAGADIAYARESDTLHAAVVVLDARSLEVMETRAVRSEAAFPYVPGFLSFRELPPLLEAFARLARRPDLVLCDGQGQAHPRRFGLACHLGVLLDVPTIGVAKSRLLGEASPPGPRKGDWSPLYEGGELLGCVLRTRERVKPVWVSPGHRIDLDSALRQRGTTPPGG